MTQRERLALGSLIVAGLFVRLIVFARTDLYIDTAYYWLWGQRLDWSYFDHPPAIAWLMRAVGVAGAALITGVGTIGAVAWLAKLTSSDARAPWYAAAFASCAPIFVLATVVGNPDSVLFLFGVLAVALASNGRVLTAGAVFGLALLSKYPAVLLAPALVVIAWKKAPPLRVVGAVVIALVCCAPIIGWNATHDWVSFRFQLDHGTLPTLPVTWQTFLEPIAAQLGLLGPIAFPLALVWCFRGPREQLGLRLAAGVPWLVFFGLGLHARQEGNWPALGSVLAVAGLSCWLLTRPRLWWSACLTSLLVSLGGGYFLSVPTSLAASSDPIRRLHGFHALSQLSSEPVAAAFTTHYGLASELAYYAHLPVGTVEGRTSQFDVWPKPLVRAGDDALWVSDGDEPPGSLVERFEQVEGPTQLEGKFGSLVVHPFHVWKLKRAR